MDIVLNYRENNLKKLEHLKIHYLKGDTDIFLESFNKESFSTENIIDLLSFKIGDLNIKNVTFCTDMPIDTDTIGGGLDSNVVFEPYKGIRKLKRSEENIDILNEDFLLEKKIQKIEKRKELSLFLFKKHKKILIVQQEFHFDQLKNTTVDYLDSNIVNSKNVVNYINKTKLNENSDDFKIMLRHYRFDKKKSAIISSFSERIEAILKQKIDILDVGAVNLKNPLMKLSRYYLDIERQEYIKKLMNPDNVVIFTDGSCRDSQQSSSFILRHNNTEISRTYLFDTNYKNYEEVAILKSLEYVYEQKLENKPVFIVSDYDQNSSLLKNLTNGSNPYQNEDYFNIYSNLLNKFNNKPLNYNLSFIKSHTDEIVDFDFIYNRKVDHLAGNAIRFQKFIPFEFVVTQSDLHKNNMNSVNLDDARVLYHEDQIDKIENNKLGSLETERALRLSRRNINDTGTIFVITKEVNREKHIRFVSKYLKNKNYFIDFTSNDPLEIQEKFSNFVNDTIQRNDFTKTGLRFFHFSNSSKELIRQEIENRIDNKDSLFTTLNSRKLLAEKNVDSDVLYQKITGTANIKNGFNYHINKNILKIDVVDKTKKKSEYKHFEDYKFKVDFSDNIYGEPRIFPAADDFSKNDIYFFFKKHDGNKIKLTYINKSEKKETLLSVNNTFQEFNEILRKLDGRGIRNCMISTTNEDMKNEFLATFNREANFDCNVVKVLHKKYPRNRLLIIPSGEYSKYQNDFSWYKKIHDDQKERKRKHKLK